MKNFLFLLSMCLLSVISYAQTPNIMEREYGYDDAGNRIIRQVVMLREGSPRQKSMSNNPDSLSDEFFTDKAGDISLKLFPNPTTSSITLQIDNKMEETPEGTVSIYTLQGGGIHTQPISSYTTRIDLSMYPSGTYLINVYINGRTTYWKIIKQ